MMALAIARNAIAHGREEVVEGILEDAGFVLGTDKSTAVTERLASAKIQTVEGKIANFKPDGGIGGDHVDQFGDGALRQFVKLIDRHATHHGAGDGHGR